MNQYIPYTPFLVAAFHLLFLDKEERLWYNKREE